MNPAGGAWGRPHLSLHLLLESRAGEARPVWSSSPGRAMPGVRPSCMGSLPAARAPLMLLNCCSWFRSATRALATCFPLSSCCLSPNHRPHPHPPIPMLLWGPWKLQHATFPHPSRGTDSPWICLWPPKPSGAAATCLGGTPQAAPRQHCYWTPPIWIPQSSERDSIRWPQLPPRWSLASELPARIFLCLIPDSLPSSQLKGF